MIGSFPELRNLAAVFSPRKVAVAAAGSEVMGAALEALRDLCGIKALLFGDEGEIRKHIKSRDWEIIHEPDPIRAAAAAVAVQEIHSEAQTAR